MSDSEETDVDGRDGETEVDATAALGGTGRKDVVPPIEKGSVVSRYVVLSELGAGAMGVVYAAYDPELDRKVAIKLVRTAVGGVEARTRLLREAQALAKLSHPNVVAVHDTGTMGERVWIAMEYVEGQTLRAWHEAEFERNYAEVLEVMVAAGRGLAAAHDAGLLHRDFKPDNVMVGRDGRVRVMDFGLARVGEATDVAARDSSTRLGRDVLSVDMTRAGTLMGTPAYMAPEQLEAKPASEQSDQFAFCVVLWELLYGERPFRGDSLLDIATAVLAGEIHPPPPRRDVPSWLEGACRRGLAVSPRDRFADMHDLLAVLTPPARSSRRIPILIGSAGAAAILLAALTLTPLSAPPDRCGGASVTLERILGVDPIERAAAGLRATGTPFAEDTARAVEVRLSDFIDTWTSAHRDACEDSLIRHEQSDALLDRRMACLDERVLALAPLVESLVSADSLAAERAVRSIEELPPIERCSDPAYLEARIPPPEGDDLSQRVDELRAELRRAEIERTLGHAPNVVPQLELLAEPVAETNYEPLRAEWAFQLGSSLAAVDRIETAVQHLEDAYFGAVALGHDEVAIRAASRLAYVVGYSQARVDEGLRWGRIAEAEVAHAGDPVQKARLDDILGILWVGKGDYARALEHHQAMLAFAEANSEGEPSQDVAVALMGIADTWVQRGEFGKANEAYEHALEIRERVWGPSHPEVALTLANIGSLRSQEGRYAEARELLEHALQIHREAYGTGNVHAASVVVDLGTIAAMEGDFDRAVHHYEDALKELRTVLGPSHARVHAVEVNLASLHLSRGDLEAARVLLQSAHDAFTRDRGPDAPELVEILHNLALIDLASGAHEAAVEKGRRVVELRERASGRIHPDVALALAVVAEGEFARKNYEAALRAVDEGVFVIEGIGEEIDPIYRAQLDLVKALILESLGRELDDALRLAVGAEVILATKGELGATALAQAKEVIGRLERRVR